MGGIAGLREVLQRNRLVCRRGIIAIATIVATRRHCRQLDSYSVADIAGRRCLSLREGRSTDKQRRRQDLTRAARSTCKFQKVANKKTVASERRQTPELRTGGDRIRRRSYAGRQAGTTRRSTKPQEFTFIKPRLAPVRLCRHAYTMLYSSTIYYHHHYHHHVPLFPLLYCPKAS